MACPVMLAMLVKTFNIMNNDQHPSCTDSYGTLMANVSLLVVLVQTMLEKRAVS